MMGEEDKNPNPLYIVPELLEEIFLRLPLKSILKFKTVSKQWRSILESRSFAERRRRMMSIQTKPKIMAALGRDPIRRRFQGDEEVEMVYLHSDVGSRPSLSCDGLVCIPVPGWVNVLNPSTGEFLRFPSGPDPVRAHRQFLSFDFFPGNCSMGFGRDNISGSYKIVRICFKPKYYCQILDVNIGEWQKLSRPPPSEMRYIRSNSASCVNGSIYWLLVFPDYTMLALDLHTEEFRDAPIPPGACSGQLVNLENRLALAATCVSNNHLNVKIWSMEDAQEEQAWSVIYSIRLFPLEDDHCAFQYWFWTRPVAVSKQGNLYFHDNHRRLFKYCPETDQVCCIARGICVISPFVEDLAPLGRLDSLPEKRTYGLQHLDHVPSYRLSTFFKRIQSRSPIILLTTTVVTLVMFRCFSVLSRS